MYAARKVLDALGNMFVNAKNVMDWLNECARDIAQHGASRTHARSCRGGNYPHSLLGGSNGNVSFLRSQRALSDGARRLACRWCRCAIFRALRASSPPVLWGVALNPHAC
jgi:hypothetical protein